MHQSLKFIFGIKQDSYSSSANHQEFITVYTSMVYVVQVVQDQDVTSWSCSQAAHLYVLLCVQWKHPDDGQRNCPKHAEFYSKNKF